MKFDIRTNSEYVRAQLSDLHKKHLPRAAVIAANRTGQKMVEGLQKEMDRVFDNPTPWIKRGVKQNLASMNRPVFSIWLEEFGGKGPGQARVLTAQIEGGPRRHKRFECALILKGLMPSGSYAVPGRQAQIDAHGNVPGSFIVRMLSDLQAFGEQGYRANRKGKRRGGKKTNYFFVPRPGSHLKPGVYWHMPNGTLGVVFFFVSSTAYQKRYDFKGVAGRLYKRYATQMMTEALATVVRTDNRR